MSCDSPPKPGVLLVDRFGIVHLTHNLVFSRSSANLHIEAGYGKPFSANFNDTHIIRVRPKWWNLIAWWKLIKMIVEHTNAP